MCELFGMCSENLYTVNDYLKTFYSHSNMHPHGWGLACMEGNNASIEKEPLQATRSNYLKERLSEKIQAEAVLGHIRYATIGNVEFQNCHPYSLTDDGGRRWTLVHNGTIFDFPPLEKYVKLQIGDTDSERIVMYLVDQVNEQERFLGRHMEPEERFVLIDSIIVKMAEGNKVNLLFFDGEYMYVHTNYKDSLYYLEKKECTLFSTKPLSEERWYPVPFTTLQVYGRGKLVFSGTNHQKEYFDNEENMKFLYQIFSNL